jgi:glycosyltransferase involved in cell wall biosynthesis
MAENMRFAFISTISSYPWGGADTLWTNAAETACARGDRVFIFVSATVAAHPRLVALKNRGAEVVLHDPPTRPPSLGFRLLRKLGLTRPPITGFISALQLFQPDLVIFSQGSTYDLVGLPYLMTWLRTRGVKYRIIVNWQEEHPQLGKAAIDYIRKTFAAADSINFVSTRNLAVTRRHLAAPLANARVIQNPLRWQPADVAPWPADPVARLATVSRLETNKGIHLLLAALANAGTALPDWQLNIFGQGPEEARLRDTAVHLGLGGRVTFRGYVKELRAIWAANHLMISPALEDGVPMTIPEAMLCQRPVLATSVGGAEDWLRDNETGFLCPAPTLPLLTATLQAALAARDRWPAMGQAAAAAAQAHYQPDDYLTLLL